MNLAHYRFTTEGKQKAEEIMAIIREQGGTAHIRGTWMDYGADIFWDTIIAESPSKYTKGMEFQLLYPNEFEMMNNGTLSAEQQEEIVNRAIK
jgi:hypothetical protein